MACRQTGAANPNSAQVCRARGCEYRIKSGSKRIELLVFPYRFRSSYKFAADACELRIGTLAGAVPLGHRRDAAIIGIPDLSARRIAAIDGERHAGHEIRGRTAEKHGGSCQIVRLAPSSRGRAREDKVVKFGNLLPRPAGEIGI